jgi:PAS domain S-box-containing protein
MCAVDPGTTEQKYRNLFENAGEAVIVFADGRAVFGNPAALRLFGMSQEESTNLPVDTFVHPDDREMVLDRYTRRLRGEEPPRSYLFRIVRRDGIARWVESRADLIDWEGRKATLVFLTDTTERKEAEQAIADGAEKFRTLFENSPDPIILEDDDVWIDGNAAALGMFGCERKEDLIGLSPWHLAPERQADGRLSRDAAKAAIETTLRQGSNRFEWLMRTFGGREAWVEVSQTVVPVGGRRIIYAVWRDITDRKRAEEALRKSEQRFRSLVEATSDFIWETGEAGPFTYASPKVRDMLGYAPEELIGKSPFDFMERAEAERVAAIFAEVAGRRESFSRLENANWSKDGRKVVLETSGVPVFDNGVFQGYRGIDRNVTDRKHLEAQLHQSRKMQAIGTLAGGIAHDFNNILMALMGYATILKMKARDK